jgi:proliferating cell nuclear antigen PCNA
MSKNTLFSLKSRDAFVFKIFSEFFSSCMMRCQFNVDKNGLTLISTDNKKHRLFCLKMPRMKFRKFDFDKPFSFDVNSGLFHRIMKTIRKKDCLSMFITTKEPNELHISISPGTETIDSASKIKINYIHPSELEIMDYSEKSYISCSGKDFQKIKNLSNIGKKTKVLLKNKEIVFDCDGGDVISRAITIGEEEREDDEKESFSEQCEVTINTSYLSSLNKISSISSNVLIYIAENCPVKITFDIPSIGDFSIFIKTEDIINKEDSADHNNMDDDINQ